MKEITSSGLLTIDHFPDRSLNVFSFGAVIESECLSGTSEFLGFTIHGWKIIKRLVSLVTCIEDVIVPATLCYLIASLLRFLEV